LKDSHFFKTGTLPLVVLTLSGTASNDRQQNDENWPFCPFFVVKYPQFRQLVGLARCLVWKNGD
jgi:hypothetical protein